MLADASCHSANLWHGSPGYLADTFETATTGQAQRSLPDIGCVDSQQRDSIYVDQSYEYAYPDPGEYLNLSKIRRAQSTYGSPGQARVERGPRWRTQSTTQQPKDFLPASSTDQSYPYPYLPAHMAGIGQQAAGADCSPVGARSMAGLDTWWPVLEGHAFDTGLATSLGQRCYDDLLPRGEQSSILK